MDMTDRWADKQKKEEKKEGGKKKSLISPLPPPPPPVAARLHTLAETLFCTIFINTWLNSV